MDSIQHEETIPNGPPNEVPGTSPEMKENHSKEAVPRLMITKMVLENFKSYAGVKEIGPFHKCFSSVVGPNGSGKSNVIDAMLFVFGKRAKKLRLNKVSDLIHSSAAYAHHPLQYASVSVYFSDIIDTGDGDDDYTTVPGTDLVVTRTVQSDNASYYRINSKKCTFKDVADFLQEKGIDLDNNRFLILQGEVEMISMMQPKAKTENDEGLLEYLEDIIGSNKYVEDITKVSQRIEELTELRQEKLNRVKAVEKEKGSLEGAKREAEDILRKDREIRRKRNIICQIDKTLTVRKLKDSEKTQESLVEKLNSAREISKESKGSLTKIEKDHKKQTAEHEQLVSELKKTKSDYAAFERKDVKLREDIKHEKSSRKKSEQKIKTEEKTIENLTKKIENFETSAPTLEENLIDLTEKKSADDAKLEDIYKETQGVTEDLRLKLESKKKELLPVQQERTMFQTELDTTLSEIKLLRDPTTRAKKQLAAAEKELSELDGIQAAKRVDQAALEEELETKKHRITQATVEENNLSRNEGELSKKNVEYLARSEDARAILQAGLTRSKAVQGILKASKKGGELSKAGILGRLGDLASTSEQYDVAVSTACNMLDFVVVKTTEGAQMCLNFLRKYNLGRANFVPLDKMKKGAHDRVVETPEGASRLYDLISVQDFTLSPVIYLAVGNTLVAPDLETATRWAYDFDKRWRVVTVDGKLIETSGTMAGGGNSVKKGGMRILNSRENVGSSVNSSSDSLEEDCSNLEKIAQKAMDDLKVCREKRRSLLDEVRHLKKRVKVLSVSIPKLSMEIVGCDTSRKELTQRIPDLQKESILSPEGTDKLETLMKKVEMFKSDMSACINMSEALDKEISEVQKSILDAGGPRLKKQKEMCQEAASELNKCKKELNAAKVNMKNSKKSKEKSEKSLESAKRDLDKTKEKIESITQTLKELEGDAMIVMQSYEKAKDSEKEKRNALDSVIKDFERIKKEVTELKGVEVEVSGELDEIKKHVKEMKRHINHFDAEMLRLKSEEKSQDEFDISDDEAEENEDVLCDESKGTEESQQPKCVLPEDVLAKYSRDELESEISILEKERYALEKDANMGAIAEYRKKEKDYLSKVSELDVATEERQQAKKEHEELRRLRLEKFMTGFSVITLKLKEMYQMITLGGDAELELVDSLDPFSEGIVFSVRPPKKSWKNIANLSGGEKTLSSLALVFALHHYKPTPLYVMDEIDAALDFKNVSIVAHYIKERTKNAQFIIISLRNNMFELADRLVGIYKTNNCTKSITINPRSFGSGETSSILTPLKDRSNKSESSH